ncbi:TetR/AcrR family transcriptional regulator [Streptomyces sp. NPDC004111]|uniref:TetR/AcrR family transcriptional regulator n=1 Tax=Streptomyces sp. NPDC004111 TaxID=3364690 RepID=UPI0036840163
MEPVPPEPPARPESPAQSPADQVPPAGERPPPGRAVRPALRREPVQQRSAERLARILDACAELLDETGYEKLSTRAVATRAGVPIGSVYRFFSNKRAMADALAQRNLDAYGQAIARRLETIPPADWRGAVDAVLDEYLAMKRTRPGFALVEFVAPAQAGVPDTRVADRLVDLLPAHLGRTPDADLRRIFTVAVEAADSVLQLAFRTDPRGDPEIIAETRILLRAYLAGVLD